MLAAALLPHVAAASNSQTGALAPPTMQTLSSSATSGIDATMLSTTDREEALSLYAFGQGEAQQLLYDPAHGLVVGYAARAASTLVVELFLQSIGELSAAVAEIDRVGKMKVHNFAKKQLPPRYRVPKTVLCRGSSVAQATNVTVSLKLVANPYTRAVSSYIHQMRTAISHRCLLRQREDADVNPMCSELNVAGKQADTIDTLMGNVSFVQWLESVKRVGLKALDMHTWPQATQLELRGGCAFALVCKLDEDLQPCLDRANAASGANLSIAGLEDFVSQQNATVVEHHKPRIELPAEDEVAAWPYAQLLELDGEPLTSNWFRGVAGNRAKALVRDLYESDFALYTYSRDDVPSGL